MIKLEMCSRSNSSGTISPGIIALRIPLMTGQPHLEATAPSYLISSLLKWAMVV